MSRRGVFLSSASLLLALGVAASVGTASASPGPRIAFAARHVSGCNRNGNARLEPSHRLPPRRLRGFVRIYCDDFNGRGHGVGHGWFLFSGQPGGDPGALFAPSHVSLARGMVTVNTYRDRHLGGGWVTGGLCLCARSQVYGAYFVRSRVTRGGDDNDELLWPAGREWPPEVDFNETGPSVTQTAAYVHYGSRDNQIARRLSIDLRRWHTWGVIWTPRAIVYTVDGRVWGRVINPRAIPRVPMTLDMQEQTFCSNGWACPTRPVSLRVDWAAEFALRR